MREHTADIPGGRLLEYPKAVGTCYFGPIKDETRVVAYCFRPNLRLASLTLFVCAPFRGLANSLVGVGNQDMRAPTDLSISYLLLSTQLELKAIEI